MFVVVNILPKFKLPLNERQLPTLIFPAPIPTILSALAQPILILPVVIVGAINNEPDTNDEYNLITFDDTSVSIEPIIL